MASNLQALDEFPTFTGEESPQEQIRQLQNYLFIVVEQLKYTMANLGVENLNSTQWEAMKTETLDSLDVASLVVQMLKSTEGESTLDIRGASICFKWGDNTTIRIENEYDNMPIIYITDHDDDGNPTNQVEISGHHIKVGGTSAEPAVKISKDNNWGGRVDMDTLLPSGDGNCKWEYIEAIGKTVLVKHR